MNFAVTVLETMTHDFCLQTFFVPESKKGCICFTGDTKKKDILGVFTIPASGKAVNQLVTRNVSHRRERTDQVKERLD